MAFRNFSLFGNQENPYEKWQPAPAVRALFSLKENLRPIVIEKEVNAEERYAETLVVGIGEIGARVLSLLDDKFAQTNKELPFQGLLISEKKQIRYKSGGIRTLLLKKSDVIARNRKKATDKSERIRLSNLFRQPVNYQEYQEWGKGKIRSFSNLQDGVQFFIVASLAEPITGIVGDILQISRSFENVLGRNLSIKNCLFLSTLYNSPQVGLSEGEQFSILREVSRFTFAGPHRMSQDFGHSVYVNTPLVDYLFVVDTPPRGEGLSTDKNSDLAQVFAENIYTLLHPVATDIWEAFRSDLQDYGKIKKRSGRAVVNGSSIATLYVPISELKRYLSVRLTQAVLFGERKGADEGFFSTSLLNSLSADNTSLYVRRWFFNGKFSHPLFEWTLDATSSASFKLIPDVPPEFDIAFMAQVSNSLRLFLNDRSVSNRLLEAKRILDWLDVHLENCVSWLEMSISSDTVQGMVLHERYCQWRRILQSLIAQLQEWQDTIFSSNDSLGSVAAPVANTSNWRKLLAESNHSERKDSGVVHQDNVSLQDLLKEYRADAEEALLDVSSDTVYRSIMSSNGHGLDEVEKYYVDTVRPELNLSRNPSQPFLKIIQRLEWWVNLSDQKLPELVLVCWNPDVSGSRIPPDAYRLYPGSANKVASAILHLAESQTASLEADLTTVWFGYQLKKQADFFKRTKEIYSRFDRNITREYRGAATRHSYLIANTQMLNSELLPKIFQNTSYLDVNLLSNGERTRFSALTYRTNIPCYALIDFDRLQNAYLGESLIVEHLYVQEKTALKYEKKYARLTHEKIILLPEVSLLLATPELVSLFFQALFVGVIKQDEYQGGSWWTVQDVGNFPVLRLCIASNSSLIDALRQFALLMPKEAEQVHSSYQSPFHPSKRERYITQLIALVRSYKQLEEEQPEDEVSQSVKQSLLATWEGLGENDEYMRSFYALMLVEADESLSLHI